eukprot:COSAG02_NODE_140_length_34374_cov_913.416443_6_plen_169_part_00
MLDGVERVRLKRDAELRRECFLEKEHRNHEREDVHAGCDREGNDVIDVRRRRAGPLDQVDGRPDDLPNPVDGCTDPKGDGAPFRGHDVREVGIPDPAPEVDDVEGIVDPEPREVGHHGGLSKKQRDVAYRRVGVAKDQDAPPAVGIAQLADHRREHEREQAAERLEPA